jgi:FKBP-type peptidyl-prolyl cis-trans isomerase SlyD
MNHQVGPDTVVHFSYRLFDEDGELVEESDPRLPLSVLFGYGQLNPPLEQALEGLRAGEDRRVSLPKEAFGRRDPNAIIEVHRDELPPGTEVGDEFDADHEELGAVSLKVLDLDAERAVLDGNHPLAGQATSVEVAVEGVRPASSSEIFLAVQDLEARQAEPETLLPRSRLLQGRTLERAAPVFGTPAVVPPGNKTPR